MARIQERRLFGRTGIAHQASQDVSAPPPLFRAGDYPAVSDMAFSSDGAVDIAAQSCVGVNAGTGHIALATNGGIAAHASGVLTMTAAGNANDTVTIGGRVYTLAAAPAAADQVDIGANAAATAANIAAAINNSGGAGYHADTVGHELVTADAVGDTVVVTARWAGSGGNSIGTAYSAGARGAFAAANLAGGRGGVVPIGVIPHVLSRAEADPRIWVGVYISGVFNPEAITWHESFQTDEAKRQAFNKGQPGFVNILIRKPGQKSFGDSIRSS